MSDNVPNTDISESFEEVNISLREGDYKKCYDNVTYLLSHSDLGLDGQVKAHLGLMWAILKGYETHFSSTDQGKICALKKHAQFVIYNAEAVNDVDATVQPGSSPANDDDGLTDMLKYVEKVEAGLKGHEVPGSDDDSEVGQKYYSIKIFKRLKEAEQHLTDDGSLTLEHKGELLKDFLYYADKL